MLNSTKPEISTAHKKFTSLLKNKTVLAFYVVFVILIFIYYLFKFFFFGGGGRGRGVILSFRNDSSVSCISYGLQLMK